MAVSVRAHDAANYTVNTASVTAVSAAKPVGLAVGDLWLIWWAYRPASADTGGPPAGFSILGAEFTGANQRSKIFYKVADSADVAGGVKTWTSSVARPFQTCSYAIAGADVAGTIFGGSSPINTLDGANTLSHSATGITPTVDGLTIVLTTMGPIISTFTPPTTQGGGWTEQHDNQMDGGANATRQVMAMFYKARTAAEGATGTITYASSGSNQASTRVLHINEAVVSTTRVTKDVELRWRTNVVKTTDARLTFPTPPGDLVAGAGLQEFRIEARKVGTGPNPLLTAYLYESATNKATLLTNQPIPDASEVFSATWNASLLTNINGSGVELQVVITGDTATYGEIVDAEWNATHEPTTTERVSKSIELRWVVSERIAKDVALQWRTLAPVGKSVTLQWRTLASVGKSIQLRWAVASGALSSVGKSVTLQWRTLASVGKSVALQWRTLAPVGKSIQLRWAVAAAALSSVGKSVTLQWRTSVAKLTRAHLSFPQPTANLVTGPSLQEFRIEARKVGSGPNPVLNAWLYESGTLRAQLLTNEQIPDASETFGAAWDAALLSNVNGSGVELRVDIEGDTASYGELVDVGWSVTKEVLTRVSKDIQLQWRTLAPVGKSIALQWRTLAPVGKSVALQWRTYQPVGKSVALQWRTLGFVGKSVELRWVTQAPLTRVSKDINLRWRTFGFVGKSAQLQWRTLQTVGKSVALQWRILTTVGKSIELRWRTSTTTLTRAHLSFPQPPVNLIPGPDLQEFRIEARKVGSGPDPILNAWLYEGGTLRGQVLTNEQIPDASETFSATWDAALLSDISGAGLELRVDIEGDSSCWGELVDVEWNATQEQAVAQPVHKDIQLRWVTSARVAKDLTLQWRVYTTVAKSIELRWATLTTVSKSVALQWRTLQSVGKSVELRWRIYTTVSKDVALQWRTLQSVGKSVELRWVTQAPIVRVSKDVALQWRTLQAVGKSVELRWVTQAPITRVSKDVTLQWRQYQSVGKDLTLQWRTLQSIGKSVALQWRVYTTTGKSTQLQWRTLASVGKSLELRWRVEVAKTTDVRLTFQTPPDDLVAGVGLQEFRIEVRKVGSGATTPLLSAYLFESATQKATLLTNVVVPDASETFSATWDAALLTNLTGAGVELRVVITGDTGAYGELVDVEWNATHLPTATERVAKDINLRWVTSGRIAKDLSLQWITYASVSKSVALRWITYQSVGKSVELRWVTQAPLTSVGKSVTLQWRTLATVGKSIELRWAVEAAPGKVAKDVTLQWRVYQIVGKSIELRWAVAGATTTRVSKDINLRWRVYETVGKSIELSWVVNVLALVRVGKSVQLRWITQGHIYKDVELRWRTLSDVLTILIEGRVKQKTYATGAVGSKVIAVWSAPLNVYAEGQLRAKTYATGAVRHKIYATGYVVPKITGTQTPRPDIYAEGQLKPKITATKR